MSPETGLPVQCMLKTTTTVLTDDRSIVLAIAGTLILCCLLDSQGMPTEELLPQETKVFEWCKDVQFRYPVDIDMRVHISKRASASEEQTIQTLAIGGAVSKFSRLVGCDNTSLW